MDDEIDAKVNDFIICLAAMKGDGIITEEEKKSITTRTKAWAYDEKKRQQSE